MCILKLDSRSIQFNDRKSKVDFIRRKQQLEALKEDDKEIKRLEKQMKLNKRKSKNLPQSFVLDGMDGILFNMF